MNKHVHLFLVLKRRAGGILDWYGFYEIFFRMSVASVSIV